MPHVIRRSNEGRPFRRTAGLGDHVFRAKDWRAAGILSKVDARLGDCICIGVYPLETSKPCPYIEVMEKSKSTSPDFSVRDFFKRFPNDEACLEHIFTVRFGERHVCRACGVESTFHRMSDRRAFACAACGDHVYPTAGTIFQDTHAHRFRSGFMQSIFSSQRVTV